MHVDVDKELKDIHGDVNSVYPWVAESWVNFPSVCFLVFSKIFSINMNYFVIGKNPMNGI